MRSTPYWVSNPVYLTYYLAGPMRNCHRYNFDAFEDAYLELTRRGYKITSPHRMDLDLGFNPDMDFEDQGFNIKDCIHRDIDAILGSSGMIMLPGWRDSVGAVAEFHVAKWAGLTIFQYPSMTEIECY